MLRFLGIAHQNAPQSDQEGQRPEQETPQVHLGTPEETARAVLEVLG